MKSSSESPSDSSPLSERLEHEACRRARRRSRRPGCARARRARRPAPRRARCASVPPTIDREPVLAGVEVAHRAEARRRSTTISAVDDEPERERRSSSAATSLASISRIRLGTTSSVGVIVPWRNSVVTARMPISSANARTSGPMTNSRISFGTSSPSKFTNAQIRIDRRAARCASDDADEREERPRGAQLEQLGGDHVGHDGPPVGAAGELEVDVLERSHRPGRARRSRVWCWATRRPTCSPVRSATVICVGSPLTRAPCA